MVEMQKRLAALPALTSDMQKFFTVKEQECGSLKSLLSRATAETSTSIDRVVYGIFEIYNSYNMLPVDRLKKITTRIDPKVDPPVISSFQVMLLNTNFYTQSRLAEDTLHGHQVGLWPALSPYLFIQIVWGLQCEELLPRFVLYLPLELSIEILNVTVSCLPELEFERTMNLVVQLTNYVYKCIYRLGIIGTQINPYQEHMRQLIANFQELLDLPTNPRVTQFPELSEQMRYERKGIILKNIIRMCKLCTAERTHGGIQDNLESFYALTFGSEVCEKLPPKLLKSCINEMDKSLIALLLSHLKEVDCNMYLAWVEIEDKENPLLNLQRAVIIECVYFVKIIQADAKLQKNLVLQNCLNQLVGSHKHPQLTLQELCTGVECGQLTDMKDLLVRYREWNEITLHFICSWEKLLLNEDFGVLFKYLKYTFSMRRCSQQEKLRFQIMVMSIVLKRPLKDMYDITLIYVLHHYHDTFLQELYNQNEFFALLRQMTGLCNSLYFLKSLLVHILHNPKEVLRTLISVTISKSDELAFSPQQLLALRPFLCLKVGNGYSFLTEMLYQLCLQPHHWDVAKYTAFVSVMLKTFVTSPEDLMTNVFIRYLVEQPFKHNNVNCILTCIYKILDTYKLKFGLVELCLVLGRKISNWRKCEPTKPRYKTNIMLLKLKLALKKCTRDPQFMTVQQKRYLLDTILLFIEPLDKTNFSPFLYITNNVLTIIDDYARRCYLVRKKYKQARREQQDLYTYISNIQLEKQDFVRHMILHASHSEYYEYCMDMITRYWFFFGWTDEIDAYDNIMRITMEAIRVGLEHPENVPFDNFTELLKSCLQISEMYQWRSKTTSLKSTLMKILIKHMSLVTASIQHREQLKAYKLLLTTLQEVISESTLLHRFWNEISKFVNSFPEEVFFEISEVTYTDDIRHPEVDVMFDSYKFICACFSIPGTEKHHRYVEKLEDIMFSEEFIYLNYHPL